ncbi:nuclear transport factor 2 family protein [Azotobacter armeniacus]
MSNSSDTITRRSLIITSATALAALAIGCAHTEASDSPEKRRGETGAQQPAASDTNVRAVLDRAVESFFSGWATGDWEPYLAMLADDFVFQFPIGPYRGRHTGPDAKQKLMAWAREHGTAGNRITQSDVDLQFYDGDWVVVCDRGIGNIGGLPYDGLHAIFMKARGGKIVEYREYMGDIRS